MKVVSLFFFKCFDGLYSFKGLLRYWLAKAGYDMNSLFSASPFWLKLNSLLRNSRLNWFNLRTFSPGISSENHAYYLNHKIISDALQLDVWTYWHNWFTFLSWKNRYISVFHKHKYSSYQNWIIICNISKTINLGLTLLTTLLGSRGILWSLYDHQKSIFGKRKIQFVLVFK